jgi:hypothetical protein
MPSEQRHAQCPRCDKKLRLTVSEKNFGHEVEVTCPGCSNTFRTTIPHPTKTREEMERQVGERIGSKLNEDDLNRLRPLLQEFGEALQDILGTSSRLEGIIEKMKRAGYDPFVVLEITAGFQKLNDTESSQSEIHEPTPLVKNGEVVPGAFTTADDKWLRDLKIDFGDKQ